MQTSLRTPTPLTGPNNVLYGHIFFNSDLNKDHALHLTVMFFSFLWSRTTPLLFIQSFLALTFLKSSGQLFCRMSMNWVSDFLLMIGFRVSIFSRYRLCSVPTWPLCTSLPHNHLPAALPEDKAAEVAEKLVPSRPGLSGAWQSYCHWIPLWQLS